MLVAKIQVSGTCAKTIYAIPITAGMIGGKVEILYTDPVWDGLKKTVVFQGSGAKDVETQDQIVTIPAKVIAQDRVHLKVGVFGVNAESVLAIPTLWAELGTVQPGADPSGDTTTDPALPVWAQIQGMIGNLNDLDTAAKNNLVAAVNEALTKGGGSVDEAAIRRIVEEYLAANPPEVTENDPTVPAWAKQPQKPTYTAAEVRALPDTYTPPNQTAQQVGADPAGTAASAVSQHNTDTAAHNDLRLALQGLSDRINAALDSDDTTLDQMSEVVAYIKSNKILIDAITTSKVSVADIVNDLATNVADKPLSAAQGVALKKLIDDLQAMIPEGGSGIAVSGATVGQTVRIAAVDDDGVPTAWEPVDLPSGGAEEWDLITKNAETGEAEPIVMDAETLRYNFPSLADYKKLFILIKKTYAATTGLTGNVWFRYTDGYGFVFTPNMAASYVEIDASLPGMCALKYLASNNLQMINTYTGTYTNVQSLVSPYWVMPNTDWAEYYANCNTTITIWGVRR